MALPNWAATVRGVGVIGEKARWSVTEHLLATIADQIQMSNVLFASANRKKGTRPPKFVGIPRPGVVDESDTYAKGDALPLDEMIALQRRWARGEFHRGE